MSIFMNYYWTFDEADDYVAAAADDDDDDDDVTTTASRSTSWADEVKLTLASDWQKKNLIKKLKEMERRQNVDYGMPIYDSDDKDAMASIQDTHTHTHTHG